MGRVSKYFVVCCFFPRKIYLPRTATRYHGEPNITKKA